MRRPSRRTAATAGPPGEFGILLDLWRAEHEGAAGLARRQQARLAALVAQARTASPFYRRRYHGQPPDVTLGDLVPVTKPELMAAFDDWVTDPGVTRAGVAAFIADPALIGTRYQGEYFVCTSSGTTGQPGIFVHDAGAINIYRSFTWRIDAHWLSVGDVPGLARRKFRWAVVVATGGHFAAAGWIELERRRAAWRARAFRVFSVQSPMSELVAALNAFDPAILTVYPSQLEVLADEQAAGRLRLHPVLVEIGGESMAPQARLRVQEVFGCPIRDVYGASEFDPLAFDCNQGWLHYHSDWAILEPVEADYRPTPPGQQSSTVLLTNLANRVQPIIRYDLGDSVLLRPGPCPCGCPLPAIRVAGRHDDILQLVNTDGRKVRISPLVVVPVLDETPGVHRVQLLQVGPTTVRLRLEPQPGTDAEQVWREVTANLTACLTRQGLANVDVVRASEPPERSARSGKFRHIIAVPPANQSVSAHGPVRLPPDAAVSARRSALDQGA